MAKNRADLLVDLIRENGNPNADLFDRLVPNCYGELYSLYSILDESEVLDHCDFVEPPQFAENEQLTIFIQLPPSMRKRCMEYLKERDHTVSYLKKDRFIVSVTQITKGMSISFNRNEDG